MVVAVLVREVEDSNNLRLARAAWKRVPSSRALKLECEDHGGAGCGEEKGTSVCANKKRTGQWSYCGGMVLRLGQKLLLSTRQSVLC